MDDFKLLSRRIALYIFSACLTVAAIVLVAAWMMLHYTNISGELRLLISAILAFCLCYIVSSRITRYALEPLRVLRQAILHVSETSHVNPPNLEKLHQGRELITKLSQQVYQFASRQNSSDLIEHRKSLIQASSIISHLPLPLFVFNKDLLVTNASDSGLEYCEIESSALFGKPLFDSVNLEFPSERTLEEWINECQQNKVTDRAYWERVRVRLPDGKTVKSCDIAAHYDRDNPSGTDYIVVMYDHSERYLQDDQSLSFVALAVHELRTPLTMLRGYVEVFEDELGPTLNDEMKDFMYKMEVSAKQVTAFVSNILNVARIENNQLTLQLTEENWSEVLQNTCKDAELKAKVHGKTFEFRIAKNLPSIAVDRISIYEVVSNLLDNAIKYSGTSEKIVITAKVNREKLIETTIQDFGVGIPQGVLPNLFEKFYRNHRTRTQVGGTGLGLFLSKAIINAHGGNIWAQSKPDEGSTFGFTLLPYAQLAEEQKKGNNDITRNAHGWIKNHSIYRR